MIPSEATILIDLRPLFLRENQAVIREGDREFEYLSVPPGSLSHQDIPRLRTQRPVFRRSARMDGTGPSSRLASVLQAVMSVSRYPSPSREVGRAPAPAAIDRRAKGPTGLKH